VMVAGARVVDAGANEHPAADSERRDGGDDAQFPFSLSPA